MFSSYNIVIVQKCHCLNDKFTPVKGCVPDLVLRGCGAWVAHPLVGQIFAMIFCSRGLIFVNGLSFSRVWEWRIDISRCLCMQNYRRKPSNQNWCKFEFRKYPISNSKLERINFRESAISNFNFYSFVLRHRECDPVACDPVSENPCGNWSRESESERKLV